MDKNEKPTNVIPLVRNVEVTFIGDDDTCIDIPTFITTTTSYKSSNMDGNSPVSDDVDYASESYKTVVWLKGSLANMQRMATDEAFCMENNIQHS